MTEIKTKKAPKASFLTLDLNESDTQEKQKKRRNRAVSSHERGVVYFSHLPHGFYEKQLRSFLKQFGTVTNLRMGRSRKTGSSKGYAFVEFLYKDVAKVVAETMNNYLMFEKLLKCQLVNDPKPVMFRNKINPNMPPAMRSRISSKKKVNATRTEEQDKRRVQGQMKKLNKLKAKLSGYGIEASVMGVSRKRKNSESKNVDDEITPKRKAGKKSTATTPVMEVDDSDEDITLKTPPHIKKIKSRSNSVAGSLANSRAASRTGTPRSAVQSKSSTPSLGKTLAKKMIKQKADTPTNLRSVAAKLATKNKGKSSTPSGTPRTRKTKSPK